MSIRFPAIVSLSLPVEPKAFLDAVARAVVDPRAAEGYVRLEVPGSDGFLFVHQSQAHFAGALEEDRFTSRSFVDFMELLPLARRAEYGCTDATLLLCIAVPFRKAPSAQIAAGQVTRDALRNALQLSMQQSGGKDAVLALRRGDAVSLALCRGGAPIAFYPAQNEVFPAGASPVERILGYLQAHADVAADIYDEVWLPAAPGAAKPFASYFAEAQSRSLIPAGLVPSLAVWMGERVVYRYVMSTDQVTVGRGGDNDLSLDNLSVSRKHAMVRRKGDRLVVTDLGSENGLVQGGKKVKEVELAPGDRVEIGKYILIYNHYAPVTEAARNPTAQPNAKASVEETLAVSAAKTPPAVLKHGGKDYKIAGMIFQIGKADDAHLKISGGLFGGVAPVHARLMRDPSGKYTITHIAGSKAVKVNGETVKEGPLEDGDVIEIGGAKITFTQPKAAGGATKLGPR